ncbi:MAG: type II toxin-antitoxin system RatA family toxin [Nisaea sp.]|jgi:coenzyme Q-binding protein COQ10|nr:type II toxin-antitoxin system RatA family toxin [Nisaea sp.]MEC7973892.1 type II toxin-antitoxin system RatA family toxin [Pseudomonadota bacterium]MED5473139.1 type II toxin-antitoxin system RatA family toxin [Pseudomonadota bacterium]|tara:strand:+ start:859 stop:1326 length:468 start_codon:yes stop_codon:yes gene_type:complete
MTTHSEQKFVPFTPDQLFEMVSDVQSYPKFLPWCVGARIRSADDELIVADLMIGYKLLRERFTSRVTLDRAKWKIETEFTDGPFKFLRNQWEFKSCPEGCQIVFLVEFEFRSTVLQKLVSVLFNEVVLRMVSAFEKRAYFLYGNTNRLSVQNAKE